MSNDILTIEEARQVYIDALVRHQETRGTGVVYDLESVREPYTLAGKVGFGVTPPRVFVGGDHEGQGRDYALAQSEGAYDAWCQTTDENGEGVEVAGSFEDNAGDFTVFFRGGKQLTSQPDYSDY